MIINNTILFKNLAILVFCLFSITMVIVVMTAYIRPSGSTGLDPAAIQQIRMHANASNR